jgi:prolyl 4-hydroxylase
MSVTTPPHKTAFSLLFLLSIGAGAAALGNLDNDSTTTATTESYSFDVSFPIHGRVSTNYPHLPHNVDPTTHEIPLRYQNQPLQILGDRQEVYLQHLDGCRAAYEETGESYKCDQCEYDRMLMNRRQPQSMVNLTTTGFQKIRAPPHLKDLIDAFWEQNHQAKDRQPVEEDWHAGNSYVNHWDSPTTLVSVDDHGLRGAGAKLKEHIWAAASATLEEWTQQELQPCSLYGIRVYHEGAVMLPHVDRLPLVASAIIGVAEDVDEDWPLVRSVGVVVLVDAA